MMMTLQPVQHLVPINKHAIGTEACVIQRWDVVLPVVHMPKVHSTHHNCAVVSPIPANQWNHRGCCLSPQDHGPPALPPPKHPPFAMMPLVMTVIVLPRCRHRDDGQKEGRMGQVHHAVVVVVVVSQTFDAEGSSAQPSQGLICMVSCVCDSLP